MSDPVVSIIIATFNRAHLIGSMLESIQDQTFKTWECIIVDDGSSDDTANVVEVYIAADSRFNYLNRSTEYKKGLPGCRNMGLDLARGEFIIFFDDDDLVHPMNLECCLKVFDDKGGYFCRYNKTPFFNKPPAVEAVSLSSVKSKPFDLNCISEMLTGTIPFASCTVMWKKECFSNIRFDERLLYAEEWDCYARILLAGYEGYTISNSLYYNLKHSKSNTGRYMAKDPIKRKSKIIAAKKIYYLLHEKNIINATIFQFFLRLGFFLKSLDLIEHVTKYSNLSNLSRLKYKMGYYCYPFIRPIFKLKAKLK